MYVHTYNRKTRKFERFWIDSILNESTKTAKVPHRIETNYMQEVHQVTKFWLLRVCSAGLNK